MPLLLSLFSIHFSLFTYFVEVTSILIDDDLLLRSYKYEDAAELFRCIDDSRMHLRRYLNWVDATTRIEHSQHFIQDALTQQQAGTSMALGIFLQSDRSLIGGIGMHAWDHDLNRAQVGYWISQKFQGKGLMYRSSQRFLDFLFQKVCLNKVEMHILPDNYRSLALAERLGAVVEGRIRQSLKIGGRLEDLVITGILRNEWLAVHGAQRPGFS